MNTANAIAVGLLLSSFALLGTWAGTVGEVRTNNALGDVGGKATAPCPYEDQTKGMGGQAGSCTFSCAIGPFSLSVSADDGDAGVSGSGSCGGGAAHCAGTGSCDGAGRATQASSGTCSGDSDEMVDSGLYVNCSSEAGGGGISLPPVCPGVVNGRAPRICVIEETQDEEGYELAADVPSLQTCKIVDVASNGNVCDSGREPSELFNLTVGMGIFVDEKFSGRNHTVSAHLFVREGVASGLVCWGFDCKQVRPTCAPASDREGVIRCDVE